MKVLVTGVSGQLGHDVVNELVRRGHEAIGSGMEATYGGAQDGSAVCSTPYAQLDICDAAAASKIICALKPEAVVHCAAYTRVDQAEIDRERCFAVNEGGTRNIAEACKKIDAKLIYISTDYVFDGTGTRAWEADCKNFAPLNVYGQSKLRGELAVSDALKKYFIVRIAWVFGKNGSNFVKTMLSVGKKHDTLKVVSDQIGTPTYTFDLARLLVDMAESEKYGYYHATNEGGFISWYDFAVEIFRQAGYVTNVLPVTTAEYGASKAVRPFNSRLDKSKLAVFGFVPLPPWKDALSRYLKEINF